MAQATTCALSSQPLTVGQWFNNCRQELAIPEFSFRAEAEGFSSPNELAYEFGFVFTDEGNGREDFQVSILATPLHLRKCFISISPLTSAHH